MGYNLNFECLRLYRVRKHTANFEPILLESMKHMHNNDTVLLH